MKNKKIKLKIEINGEVSFNSYDSKVKNAKAVKQIEAQLKDIFMSGGYFELYAGKINEYGNRIYDATDEIKLKMKLKLKK